MSQPLRLVPSRQQCDACRGHLSTCVERVSACHCPVLATRSLGVCSMETRRHARAHSVQGALRSELLLEQLTATQSQVTRLRQTVKDIRVHIGETCAIFESSFIQNCAGCAMPSKGALHVRTPRRRRRRRIRLTHSAQMWRSLIRLRKNQKR